MNVCGFEDCTNKAHYRDGYCRPHHEQNKAGEPLRAVRKVAPKGSLTGRVCEFAPCGRPVESGDHCKQHNSQLRKHGKCHEIGNSEATAAHRREAWARLTPEQRKARTSHLLEYGKRPKTAEHVARMAESRRVRWAERGGMRPVQRTCWGCGVEFTATGPRQHWCKAACQSLTARLRKYGLTVSEYRDMLASQGDGCALCDAVDRGFRLGVGLVIDHCHSSGRVRGLLCGDCNTALGRFGDDPIKLRRAAEYLERK